MEGVPVHGRVTGTRSLKVPSNHSMILWFYSEVAHFFGFVWTISPDFSQADESYYYCIEAEQKYVKI